MSSPQSAPVVLRLAMNRDPLTGPINVTAFCRTALYEIQIYTRLRRLRCEPTLHQTYYNPSYVRKQLYKFDYVKLNESRHYLTVIRLSTCMHTFTIAHSRPCVAKLTHSHTRYTDATETVPWYCYRHSLRDIHLIPYRP